MDKDELKESLEELSGHVETAEDVLALAIEVLDKMEDYFRSFGEKMDELAYASDKLGEKLREVKDDL